MPLWLLSVRNLFTISMNVTFIYHHSFVLDLSLKKWSGAGGELDCALTVLQEFRIAGVMPNKDTYSILLAACERYESLLFVSLLFHLSLLSGALILRCFYRGDELSIALKLYNQSKGDSVQPTLEMCESILGTFKISFTLYSFWVLEAIMDTSS